MLNSVDCFAITQAFFAMTSVLFLLTTFIFMNRSRHLRKKVSRMIEALNAKNKELDEMRSSQTGLLAPLKPGTTKSIIVSIDLAGKITDVNDYALEVFGYARDEMVGQNVYGTIYPTPIKKDSLQATIVSRIFANPKLYIEHETENIKKSGEHFWISWTNRVIYNNDGTPLEIRSVGFDITKRKRLEDELKFLASTDPLTGALNRQTLLEVGAREIKRANRYERQLAVVIMKLNYFHSLLEETDTSFSDEVLQKTIAICRNSMRDSDYIGRVGDVEFALILTETPAENAVFLAERLKAKIQECNLKSSSGSFITATFGVSGRISKDDTIDSLLLRAFQALQEADKNTRKKLTKKQKKEDTPNA